MSRVNMGSNRCRIGRIRRTVAVAAVAALLFSACAADDEPSLAADDEAAQAATGIGTAVLPTVSGGQIDTNDLEGTDTILWFWAPW